MHRRERRDHLLDARVERARVAVEFVEQRDLVGIRERRDRVVGQVEPVRRGRLPGLDPPRPALARNRARRARRLGERRRHDLVRVREPGALARHRAHADALLDAVAALLDDTVLQHPVLLARELEVEVARIHGGAEQRAEGPLEPALVESGRRENPLARQGQCVHAQPILRWSSAGNVRRVSRWPSRSSAASTTPLPRGSRASTWPQWSMTRLSP